MSLRLSLYMAEEYGLLYYWRSKSLRLLNIYLKDEEARPLFSLAVVLMSIYVHTYMYIHATLYFPRVGGGGTIAWRSGL